MAGEMKLTVVGNLVADPELRHVPSGLAVAEFTVAQSDRRYNAETQTWEDGDAAFLRCQVWRDYAENVAATLHKGDRVIVSGRLSQERYETKDGEKRTTWRLEVEDVGPALRFARATVQKLTTRQPEPVPA